MDDRPPGDRADRGDRIRRLGYNPAFLTPEEQRELLEIDARMRSSAREQPEVRAER